MATQPIQEAQATRQLTAVGSPENARPHLAPGVELLGQYKGSGFKEPPFLVRRPDGQIVQLPGTLYAIAELADGSRDSATIGEELSQLLRRGLDADAVDYLVREKLVPLGVMAAANGRAVEVEKPDPLLALKFRARVVPRWVVRALTAVFRPLFFGPVVLAALGAFVAFDVWLFGIHGVAQGIRATLSNPTLILMLVGLLIASAGFHEFGHATACRYGGAEAGAMGVGLYLVWPAFYTDITDSYRLGKGGRLRTDLGGLYFNALFILATGAVYFATRFEPLLLVAVVLVDLQGLVVTLERPGVVTLICA